jgi:ribonuclease Z
LRDKEEALMNITRRAALKSGLLIGGLALEGEMAQASRDGYINSCPDNCDTYFDELRPYYPGKETLGANEMRITFLGTWFAERFSQACNSIFVELGNGENFVFDCGAGVLTKYNAMGIPQSKLNKIFLTHLHADHMNELSMLYAFGSSWGRMQPLYVWGPSRSGIKDPSGNTYNDGTADYCANIHDAFIWHTQSQSFLPTQIEGWTPPSWAPQNEVDSYDLVPFELNWNANPGSITTAGGTAYDYNGVTINYFPSVHNRAGAIAYKLMWNGLSMIFTGDTKPNKYLIYQANGVDLLIHEMTTSPVVWTEKMSGLKPGDPGWDAALAGTTAVQLSSHTVDKAFGYVLSQIATPPSKAPRLTIATHYPASDETIGPSLRNVRYWYPQGNIIIALDLMVVVVSPEKIDVRRAVVPEFAWPLIVRIPSGTTAAPEYPTPTYQLDPTQLSHTIDQSVYGPELE